MSHNLIKKYIKLLEIYWPKNHKVIYKFFNKNHNRKNLIIKDISPVSIKLEKKYSEKNFEEIVIPKFLYKKSINEIDWLSCIHFLSSMNNNYKDDENLFSYSNGLSKNHLVYMEKAWINRYALLIRKIISIKNSVSENNLFGKRPKSKLIITHDIDVTKITFNFLIKQLIFIIFNFIKLMFSLKIERALDEISRIYYLIIEKDYTKYIREIIKIEKNINCKKIFFINSNINKKKNIFSSHNFINPNYDLEELSFLKKREILNNFEIGIHPTVQTFNSSKFLKKEKEHIEFFFNQQIFDSRQHWLKFQKNITSSILKNCNIKNDYTFGFNDLSGFRGSCALILNENNINRIPMAMMDSHLYDYNPENLSAIKSSIKKIIEEIIFVGGVASINWHPHTLSKSYGWRSGYLYLIKLIKKNEKNLQ